ncbi:N-acetylneuraminate synthase family protein [Fibrobacterota bacterium]
MREIKIGNVLVGESNPCFLIAEIGSNHNRDIEIVKRLVDVSAEAGINCVKFQTYEPQEVFSGKITTRDVGYEDMYGFKPWWEVARDRILMPREWFKETFEYIREKNMLPLSTVHSAKDAEFVMQFDPPAFKVASIDVSYLEFLRELAGFNKPIILSTGMSQLGEIEKAVQAILSEGNDKLTLLHCVSCYPPEPEIVNLRNIILLRKAFGLPVGFSDHHPENYLAASSIALGACILEKHITLDRNMEGPDHPFALEPEGIRELVVASREVEAALGSSQRSLSVREMESRKQIRRSIVARCDINPGELIKREMLKMSRPGTGIEPEQVNFIIGRKAQVLIEKDDVITMEMLDQS